MKTLSTPRVVSLRAAAFSVVVSGLTAVGGAWAQSAPAAPAADRAAGQKKIDLCIGCHGISGYQASFPQVYKVPKLSGQNAKYIVSALTQYKKGDRKHPTMRAIAVTLTDQDMADIAAFYEQQGQVGGTTPPAAPATPPTDVAALLQRGNCVSCHGADFNKPIDPSYPKLAGQHADYLFVALKAYQVDNNPQVGRNNAIMKGMAKPYTHAELQKLGSYIGSLRGELKTVEQSYLRVSD